MIRTISIFVAVVCSLVAMISVGCWSSTGEVTNNSKDVPFVPSPMPEDEPPGQEVVRVPKKPSNTNQKATTAEQVESPKE
jgi:hypothetical protein